MKRRIYLCFSLLLIAVGLSACEAGGGRAETIQKTETKEKEAEKTGGNVFPAENREGEVSGYLQIITTRYTNGIDDGQGISLGLYQYNIQQDMIEELCEIPIEASYPIAYGDLVENRVYFSDGESLYDPDNLFAYDLDTKEITQLTYGKFLFNDFLPVGDISYIIGAGQYKTVTQPGIFNREDNEIRWLNEDDDDTWYQSLSYYYPLDKLLVLSYSDSVMRTHKVTAETHIRPKSICMMDRDFSNITEVFNTDCFEIRVVRMLDEAHILMTTDESMASLKPVVLKKLNIVGGELEDVIIEGVREIYTFFPDNAGQGIFILGTTEEHETKLFYYDFVQEVLSVVLERSQLPENHKAIVDFYYYLQ